MSETINNADNRYQARRMPDSVFRNRKPGIGRTGAARVMAESPKPVFKSVNYPDEGGMEVMCEGWLLPEPYDVDPWVIDDLNQAKAETMGYVELLSHPALRPVYVIIAFTTTWDYKIKLASILLNAWCRNVERRVYQDFLEYDKYQPMIYELMKFAKRFLMRLGFAEDLSMRVAENFLIQPQFDNQYFLRMYDLFNEIENKQAMLDDPGKEVTRLLEINAARGDTEHTKFKKYGTLLKWILKHPRIKRAFKTAWEQLDLNQLYPDDRHLYHSLHRSGYNYGGKTDEERRTILFKLHKDNNLPEPPYVKVTK